MDIDTVFCSIYIMQEKYEKNWKKNISPGMGVEPATSTNRGKFIYYVVYIEYPLAVHTPSPGVVFVHVQNDRRSRRWHSAHPTRT